jgi:hypothetical protein
MTSVIALLAFTSVVFRFEVALLAGIFHNDACPHQPFFLVLVPMMIVALLRGYIGLPKAALWTLVIAAASLGSALNEKDCLEACLIVILALTIIVDSLFWQRQLWPEGDVLYFNTLLNKSKNWGVSPWHWYLSAAIPKTMTIALVPPSSLFWRCWQYNNDILDFCPARPLHRLSRI